MDPRGSDQEGGHTPVMFRSWRRLGGAARKTLRQAGDREDALPTAVARSGTQEIELDSVDTVEERFKASQARAALKEEGGAAQPLSTEASSKPLRWAGLRRYLHFDSNASRLADPVCSSTPAPPASEIRECLGGPGGIDRE